MKVKFDNVADDIQCMTTIMLLMQRLPRGKIEINVNGAIGFPEVVVHVDNDDERETVLACVREGHRVPDDVDVAETVTITA
jgi:hypothetical protein